MLMMVEKSKRDIVVSQLEFLKNEKKNWNTTSKQT